MGIPFSYLFTRQKRRKSKGVQVEEDVVRAMFDAEFYIHTYADVLVAGVDPLKHFLNFGWKEWRRPRADFDTRYYYENTQEVRARGINPFYHYLTKGKAEGRPCLPVEEIKVRDLELSQESAWIEGVIKDHFDKEYYLKQNPDVMAQGIDPLVHYIAIGWKEGRNPSNDFDIGFYLKTYEDVNQAGIEPLTHFIAEGRKEGRVSRRHVEIKAENADVLELSRQRKIVQSYFDSSYYLKMNLDVKRAGVDSLDHFLTNGWREYRDPSPEFSTEFYLHANPDVAEADINPLLHFALSGEMEGRLCKHPGGYRAEILKELKSIEERVNGWILSKTDAPGDIDSLQAVLAVAVSNHPDSRVVFSFSHDDYLTNTGGVQSCIQEEQSLFCRDGSIYLHLSPVQSLPTLASLENDWIGRLSVNGLAAGQFSSDDLMNQLRVNFQGREVVFIVHALHGHNPEWITDLHHELGVATAYFWLHDYFSMCIGYNLLRNDVSYCSAPKVESNGCQLCVYGEERVEHQARIGAMFQSVEFNVVSPSSFTLELWKKKSMLPFCSAMVREHRQLRLVKIKKWSYTKTLKVAFLGYPANHKGWPVFQKLVRKFEEDERYTFYHFGMSTDSSLKLEHVVVQVSNENPDAMQQAVRDNEIDVALILSICPETYCLTAYEALIGGAVLVTGEHSGNVAHMIRERSCGLVFNSEEQLMSLFQSGELIDHVVNLREKGIGLYESSPSGMTASIMADQLALAETEGACCATTL